MRKAVSGISIQEKNILLVYKNGYWILPGGKPESSEESDVFCLLREFGEELPDIQCAVGKKYGTFIGQAPHKKDTLSVVTYFVKTKGPLTTGNEISAAQAVNKTMLQEMKLSEITRTICDTLIAENLL